MAYLNVLYFAEYDSNGNVIKYEDCDLIYVPDFVAYNSDGFAQSFCRWLESGNATDDYYYIENDHRFIICDTSGFVRWLNNFICFFSKASIVKKHADYCSCYGIIDF